MPAEAGCPCGEIHELAAGSRALYEAVTAGRPAAVEVVTTAGSWRVPRIWIAVHGLRFGELPGLAARYGFERVPD